MAALSAERNTRQMDAQPIKKLSLKCEQSVQFYKGQLVALDADGYLIAAATASSLTAAGCAAETKLASSAADGTDSLEVWMGVFKYDNKSGDLVVQADVGLNCYMYDDHTVNHTSTGASVAGKVVQVDSDGVWVSISLY